jgi:transcriptional regulator with XRE-family HTH domain
VSFNDPSETDLRREFSKRLKARLAELGINQSDLARASGMSKDAISTYLRERSIPTRENLKKIGDALQVDPAQLLPSAYADAPAGQPVIMNMLPSGRVRLRVDADVRLPAATKILEIVSNETADAEGGR